MVMDHYTAVRDNIDVFYSLQKSTNEEDSGLRNCQSGLCDASAGQVSTDGRCGPKIAGTPTCVGSKFGDW